MQQRRWGLLALAQVLWAATSAVVKADVECQHIADKYLERHHKEASPYTGKNMVYFLHVPRTAGRTFHSCFLKVGTAPGRRCPKAYDHLRINTTVPNCYLLSSHDDFSVVSLLPDDVSVLTQLRDPVDRFLSAYEFAIEVGSRQVNRPANFRKRGNKIATEDVWPWSYLIPFFAEDVRKRLAIVKQMPLPPNGNWFKVRSPDGDEFYYNKMLNISKWNLTAEEQAFYLPPLDPYDNPLVMPLADFVRHPIAKELLHNGAAFQVLGITNYSHWGDAEAMRKCVWEDAHTAQALLNVASSRVKRFMHVGTTDRLGDSVAAAAASLGLDLDKGHAYPGGEEPSAAALQQQHGSSPDANAKQYTASDLPALAKRTRELRLRLQSAQKRLLAATQEGQGEDLLTPMKEAVNNARGLLREAQDELVAARAQLPAEAAQLLQAAGAASEGGRQLLEDEGHEEHGAHEEVEGAALGGAVGGRRLLQQDASAAAGGTSADPGVQTAPKAMEHPLGYEYQRCAQRAQQRNNQRRDNSLASLTMKDGRSITFSKAARKAIPEDIIAEIRSLNQLDTSLHKLGLEILDTRRGDFSSQGKLQQLPYVQPIKAGGRAGNARFKIPKPERDEL